MRIVSLLPACTEWVAAFGGLDELIGRSHACDFPTAVRTLPVVTRPAHRNRLEGSEGAPESANSPRGDLAQGISPFEIDLDLIVRLKPDLILTQTQCDVCAVSVSRLMDAISRAFNPVPDVFSMSAHTMKGVLDDALKLGRMIDRTAESMKTIAGLERRLHALRDRLGLGRRTPTVDLPSVAALEWLDPIMTAGHWIPDIIELAGGRPVLASPGARSEPIEWRSLRELDPDMIAVAPCATSLDAARRSLHRLTDWDGWSDMRAVLSGRVYLFDGNAYFNRPGPRLYRSVELMAFAIYGARAGIDVQPEELAAA